MGIIRSGAVVFVSALLFLTVFVGNIFLTLSWSLEYDNVQPVVTDLGKELIEGSGVALTLEQNYDMMLQYCNVGGEDFSFSQEGVNISIPCSEISKGPEAMVDYGINEVVENFYYKNYDCSFFECLKNEGQPYVLISEKARDYFKSNYNWILVFMIILFVVLFLLVESKSMAFIISGILVVFTALPFRKFDWVLEILPGGIVSDFFLAFFTRSYNVFMTMIIVGVSLFIIGISLHFLGWGVKLSEFFRKHMSKDSEKNKKGEVSLSEVEELRKEVKELKEETSRLKKKD